MSRREEEGEWTTDRDGSWQSSLVPPGGRYSLDLPLATRPLLSLSGKPDTYLLDTFYFQFGSFLDTPLLPAGSSALEKVNSQAHFGAPATMERGVEDTGGHCCVTLSPNYRHHHPVDGGDQHCGLQLELRDLVPCNQELRCERSALTVPLLRQDPPAYAKTSPSSPASSTLTTSTLLSPSLLPVLRSQPFGNML